MSDTTAFRMLIFALYVLPLCMLITPLLSDKSIDQVIGPSILLVIIVIIGFEIMHGKYDLLPKEICKKLIKETKSKYMFNKECHNLAALIFYFHATISFSILFAICIFACNNFMLKILSLISLIISSSKTSISIVKRILRN